MQSGRNSHASATPTKNSFPLLLLLPAHMSNHQRASASKNSQSFLLLPAPPSNHQRISAIFLIITITNGHQEQSAPLFSCSAFKSSTDPCHFPRHNHLQRASSSSTTTISSINRDLLSNFCSHLPHFHSLLPSPPYCITNTPCFLSHWLKIYKNPILKGSSARVYQPTLLSVQGNDASSVPANSNDASSSIIAQQVPNLHPGTDLLHHLCLLKFRICSLPLSFAYVPRPTNQRCLCPCKQQLRLIYPQKTGSLSSPGYGSPSPPPLFSQISNLVLPFLMLMRLHEWCGGAHVLAGKMAGRGRW